MGQGWGWLGWGGALPAGRQTSRGSWLFSGSGTHCWPRAGEGRARPGSQHASWFSSLAGVHGGPVPATTWREASRLPCRPSHPPTARREEGAETHAGTQRLAAGRGLHADLAEPPSFRCETETTAWHLRSSHRAGGAGSGLRTMRPGPSWAPPGPEWPHSLLLSRTGSRAGPAGASSPSPSWCRTGSSRDLQDTALQGQGAPLEPHVGVALRHGPRGKPCSPTG